MEGTTVRCRDHDLPNCGHSRCRRERERQTSTPTLAEDVATSLSNPASPLHQAVYGGTDYGSTSSDCSTTSSYDSGSSSCDSGGGY